MLTLHTHYWFSKLLHLCGLFLVVGLLPHALPGAPLALYENWPTPAHQRALLIKEYGFDRSLPVQYGIWLQRTFTGRWGQSRFHNRPVLTDVMQATGYTCMLLVWTALAWSLCLGVLRGCRYVFPWSGGGATKRPLWGILEVLPNFLLAVILHDIAIWQLGWLGMANVSLRQPYAILNPLYMLFPGMILALMPTLAWQYGPTTTALPNHSWTQRVSWRWRAFRKTFQPFLAGFLLEVLLTEHVLTLPGLGSLGITALKRRDFPLFQGFLLCTGGLYFLLRLIFEQTDHGRNQPLPASSYTPPADHDRRAVYSGLWGLMVLIILTVLATLFSPYSPTEIHSHDQLLRPGYRYLLGTDFLGRDVLSRTLGGFRSTIPQVLLLMFLTGSIAWLGLRLLRLCPPAVRRFWHSSAALGDIFPPFILACMLFLIVEPFAYPLEATLVFACLPSAGQLFASQAMVSQYLASLARLGERLLVLKILFFFLNLSPESLAPSWGSDIRHGMHYGHLNMWLILAPTLAVVWSRSIFHQLSLSLPALACLFRHCQQCAQPGPEDAAADRAQPQPSPGSSHEACGAVPDRDRQPEKER
jgi:peptide/nickel transport system permease protein